MNDHLSEIIKITGLHLSHDLWVSIIDEVAHLLVANRAMNEVLTTEELDEKASELLKELAEQAIPWGDHLLSIIGESDHFNDLLHDLSWSEFFQFSGDPCEFSYEVVNSLKNSGHYPEAEAYISEDLVNDLFASWRIRFIELVLNEAKSFKN